MIEINFFLWDIKRKSKKVGWLQLEERLDLQRIKNKKIKVGARLVFIYD